jgi:hypothetical protein
MSYINGPDRLLINVDEEGLPARQPHERVHNVGGDHLEQPLHTAALNRPSHEIISVEALTIFYTLGLGIVVLHVMVPPPYRFSLCFLT